MEKYTLREVQIKLIEQIMEDYDAVNTSFKEEMKDLNFTRAESLNKTKGDLLASKDILIEAFEELIDKEEKGNN